MVINWTLKLLSHNLVLLNRLISFPCSACILKARFPHQSPQVFLSFSHLLTIYKSQILYCSHVWGGASKSTLCILDKVQSKAIRLINNPNLTNALQPLSHRRLAGDLSIFINTLTGIVLKRSGRLFLFLGGVSEPPEAQLVHALSKFHCLLHELCPTNHISSLEYAIYGTSRLPLAFLNLTTYHLSNPR